MTWAQHYAPIIERLMQENVGADAKTLARVFRYQFPSGPKQYHPYKVWRRLVRQATQPKRPPKTSIKVDDGPNLFSQASNTDTLNPERKP